MAARCDYFCKLEKIWSGWGANSFLYELAQLRKKKEKKKENGLKIASYEMPVSVHLKHCQVIDFTKLFKEVERNLT